MIASACTLCTVVLVRMAASGSSRRFCTFRPTGVLASALGTELCSKLMYEQAGVPTPKGIDVPAGTVFTDEQSE